MTPIGQMSSLGDMSSSNDTDASGIPRPPSVGLFGSEDSATNLPPLSDEQISSDVPIATNPNQTPQKEFTSDGRSNPGPFDKADQEAMRVLRPDVFDGCRFEHNKGLGDQFSVSHSLWLGSAMLQSGNNYTFGSTLVLNGGRTMLLGRMSDDMRLDAQMHHEILQPQRLVSRIISSIGQTSDQSVTHGTLEYNGADFNANVKVSKGPLFAMSYFQSVAPWLNMGAEAFHSSAQGVSHVFGRAQCLLNRGDDVVNATASSMGGVNLSYVRKVSDRVRLATELEYNALNQQSAMNVGYEFLLRQTKISGVVSSEGTIQSQVTEAIAPGFHIVFNAMLNHKQDSHKFGYGVQLG